MQSLQYESFMAHRDRSALVQGGDSVFASLSRTRPVDTGRFSFTGNLLDVIPLRGLTLRLSNTNASVRAV